MHTFTFRLDSIVPIDEPFNSMAHHSILCHCDNLVSPMYDSHNLTLVCPDDDLAALVAVNVRAVSGGSVRRLLITIFSFFTQ